jgi:hypothetical protein
LVTSWIAQAVCDPLTLLPLHLVAGTDTFLADYENESAEMAQSNPPVDLTPELWLVKLLLGAIDHSYDRKDEAGRRA